MGRYARRFRKAAREARTGETDKPSEADRTGWAIERFLVDVDRALKHVRTSTNADRLDVARRWIGHAKKELLGELGGYECVGAVHPRDFEDLVQEGETVALSPIENAAEDWTAIYVHREGTS